MKKLFYTISILALSLNTFAQQKVHVCGTDEHLQANLKADPALAAKKAQFEQNWKVAAQSYNPNDYKNTKSMGKAAAKKYIIPVVVHVFHSGTSSIENISDAQIKSEIAQLNKSFRNLNSDTNKRREIFKDIAADMEVEFRLAKKDPKGNCTNGIVRVYTPLSDNGDDVLKTKSVWDTKRYFNMWVVRSINRGSGIGVAGYAQFPFAAGALSAATDGVMVIYNEFGNIEKSLPGQTPNVTTTTHEAGHWLGLYHPFQDSDTCDSEGDGVFDTPKSFFRPTSSYPLRNECGNPTYNSCGGKDYRYIPEGGTTFISNVDLTKFGEALELPDMQENFMDYFIGSCASNMFTLQQKARVHFCLENYRSQLWDEENLLRIGVSDSSPANFCLTTSAIPSIYSNVNNICAGNAVTFSNNTYNGTATAYNWTFDGGTPATSTAANPGNVVYANPGVYNVKLSITTNGGTVDTTYVNYVNVANNVATNATLNFADWEYQNNWQEQGWSFVSENGRSKWVRQAGVSYNGGIASMKLEDDPFNQIPSSGFEQSFISPSFNLSAASNPTFNFAFATALTTGPGSATSADELRVYSSTNCGTTWTQMTGTGIPSLGTNISTTGTTRLDYTIGFVPTDKSKWREVSLVAPKQANVRFKITLLRKGGATFFLDDVRVSASGSLGVKDLAEAINFNIAPNPFNTSTELSYDLTTANEVKISVIDILGRDLGTVQEGKQQAGNHTAVLDKNTLGLTNGIYFVRVELGNQSFVKKIMVN
ncbi:MAG: zinc-dependent metalloprotease [Bacteroidota bacterium]